MRDDDKGATSMPPSGLRRWGRRAAYGVLGLIVLSVFLLLAPIVPFDPHCEEFNRKPSDEGVVFYRPIDWEISQKYAQAIRTRIMEKGYYSISVRSLHFVPLAYYLEIRESGIPKLHREYLQNGVIYFYDVRSMNISSNSMYVLLRDNYDKYSLIPPPDMSPFGGPSNLIYYSRCQYMPLVTKPGVFD